jgi:hypothetical protein
MNFDRVSALIERDMRKFFRSPALMVSSLIFPLVQLIVLGYAFGGKIKGAKVAFVDQDHSVLSRRVREMFDGVAAGPATFKVVDYDSETQAVDDLRAGFVRGVVELPQHFSQHFYDHDRPQIAFSEDNTDQVMAGALEGELQDIVTALNAPAMDPRLDNQVELDVVEVYPYVEYAKYLLAGSTSMAIFIVAMIGGGITFIDDKSRGRAEGIDGRHVDRDHRRHDRGNTRPMGSGAAVLSVCSDADCLDCHDQLYVRGDGAGERSSCAARGIWRAEHAPIFPVRRHFAHRGISEVASLDVGSRSVYVHGSCAAQSDGEEYRD